jgi:hypothetical protein
VRLVEGYDDLLVQSGVVGLYMTWRIIRTPGGL